MWTKVSICSILFFCIINNIKRKLERFSGQLTKTWVMHSCCHFMPLQRLERVAAKLWRRKDDILGLIGITLILAVFGTVFSAGKQHFSFNTLNCDEQICSKKLGSNAELFFKTNWGNMLIDSRDGRYRYRCLPMPFLVPAKTRTL